MSTEKFGDLERCALRPGNVHSADGWEGVLKPTPQALLTVTRLDRPARSIQLQRPERDSAR